MSASTPGGSNQLVETIGLMYKFLVAIVLAVVIGALLVLYLSKPDATIDVTAMGLLELLILVMLIPLASKIVLPGGTEIGLMAGLLAAKDATDKAARALGQKGQPGLMPPKGLSMVSQPSLLDARSRIPLEPLRIEIEKRLLALAQKSGIEADLKKGRIGDTLEKLRSKGILTDPEMSAIEMVHTVSRQPVRAGAIPSSALYFAADIGESIFQILDEKLSRPS